MLAKRLAHRSDDELFPGWARLADVQPGGTVTTYDANWSIDPLAARLGVTRWACAEWGGNGHAAFTLPGLADTFFIGAGANGRTDIALGWGCGGRVLRGVFDFDAGQHAVAIGTPGGGSTTVGSLATGRAVAGGEGAGPGPGGAGITTYITGSARTFGRGGLDRGGTSLRGDGATNGATDAQSGYAIIRVPLV